MVTIILIAITCLVSILCFTGTINANKLLFHAYSVWHRKEWYRMLTYGVVHGGWGHLLFNMLTLFFFGRVVEQYFQLAFGGTLGIVLYVVLYVTAILVSTIWGLVKYKDDWNYSAVGASGAVSASSSRWSAAPKSSRNLPSSSSTIVSHSCTVTNPSSVISDSIVKRMQKYVASNYTIASSIFVHRSYAEKT